jgi:hypothetical protein
LKVGIYKVSFGGLRLCINKVITGLKVVGLVVVRFMNVMLVFFTLVRFQSYVSYYDLSYIIYVMVFVLS